MKTFLEQLKEKVLVFDGATGSTLQTYGLTADDFGGKDLEGCNEYLCVSKPEVVTKLHSYFLEAGADVIETNSFGTASIVLNEYNIANLDYELSLKSAQLAKSVAKEFSTNIKPRFVAGSIGPTTKLPSLGHITFDEMEESYYRQMSGLFDGGVDLFCIETCQDLLQIKCALAAADRLFRDKKRKLPVIVSVTVETMGTMLMGTDISAALTVIEPYDLVDIIGMNCATGPKEMEENIRYLCHNSPKNVFCMPNAGIPENVSGKAHYHLTPEEMEKWATLFVKDFGVRVVGGCCGTNAEHIRKLSEVSERITPVERKWEFTSSVASLYSISTMTIDPAPVLVGERCNANGSRQFKNLLEKEDYDAMVNMAKEQVKEGAHILDICVAYVGRDEVRDMTEVIKRFNTAVTLPLMIDSTEVNVIETALKLYAGRAIINSINFEEGTVKADKILALAKRYGAAVVALSIDEEGQAYDLDKKVAIAKRIRDHAAKEHNFREEDLIFDTLTFPLGSGQEDLRKSGINTIKAITEIKKIMPKCKTILGLSNCSFGLSPHIRHVLNSVFLHYAIEAGLDMVIVHAGKIMPLYKIDEKGRQLATDLIFDNRKFEEVGE
ncbi:MAG: homocysteine S-methyltransferase family protein [Ignavibacteriota bacterium]|nr:homocysteine S-methyltransferase family protein [Ignavibacteriota bacterium]